jgi:adhesin transport system outer membrane protein
LAESIVARAEQKSAKAALLPQLIGQLSSNEVLGERIGLALRAQTGNGLSQAAAAQGAGERARASEEAIVSAQRELREALRLDFVNNAAARERIGSADVAAKSSLFVVESYKRQFIAGRRTWLDVMNALQESTNMRLAIIDSETSAQQTNARIALRTCTWQPRLQVDRTESING